MLTLKSYEFSITSAGRRPEEFNASLMPYIEKPDRYISIRDMGAVDAPEFVEKNVADAFNQGATCVAVECWDAAAAMFRKSIDLATKPLLPLADEAGLNARIRRDLGLRLPWLFENNKIPRDLVELAKCVREDGNDGAHNDPLGPDDACDLLDFCRALLERLYTEPARLKAAEMRRSERRSRKDT